MRAHYRLEKLDEIAINIQVAFISLIEGLALVSLAENTVRLLETGDAVQYAPYILTGLVFILVFWSQALLHAISFIRWPLRMWTMFLYFCAAFVQVIAYSSMKELSHWFLWWTVFSLIGFGMYVVDLRIIRSARLTFNTEYIATVERRHLHEMKHLLPLALLFNVSMFVATSVFPDVFESRLSYALPGIVQLVLSLGGLFDCVRSFQSRSEMIQRLVQ